MKPLDLEMTAFGSFAETTRIPFEQLRQGLYLVAGDTGAGKTTIFDAVVFALYGKASGRDRTPAMLHSDYVEKSTDTLVKLRFEQNGREYTVSRSVHFPRKKGTEKVYGDQQLGAILLEPDREPTEGAEKVTRRVEELLGLNAEQFRKIIMLAQGEFREFLKADSDKKNEILGKLFDNSAYLRYQNLLSGARDELARRRTALREELQQLMRGAFRPPEDADGEKAAAYLAENPELAENLRRLTQEETERLAALGREREALRRQVNELNSRKGAAEAVNAQFEALEQLRLRLNALDGKTEEMEALRARLDRGELAFHRVRPAMESLDRARRSLEQGLADREKSRADAALWEEKLRAAAARAEMDGEKRQRAGELNTELTRLDEQLRRLRDREKTREERKGLLRETERVAARRDEEEKALLRREESLENQRTRLEELSGAEALALRRQGECEQAAARCQALADLEGERAALQEEETVLERKREALERLARRALSAREEHLELYRRFLAGQAGLMARDLRREILRQGEAVCPVCGSRLREEQTGAFASLGEQVPEQSLVEQAREAADRAERDRSEEDKRLESLIARHRSRRDAALQEMKKVLGTGESLDPAFLSAASEEARERERNAESALAEARELEREQKELRRSLPLLEKEAAEARERLETLAEKERELRSRLDTLEALIREQTAQLRFSDEAEALAAREETARSLEALNRELEQNRAALDSARTGRDTAAGSLTEREQLAARQERELEEARAALDRALAEAGFAERGEAERALPPAEAGDPARWLREQRERLNAWENERVHSARELERQSELLRDQRPADLPELSDQLERADAALNRCGEAWGQQENLLANHLQVLDRVARARAALDESEGSWKRLERLGSMAAGMNSEGGKLSFDRYVMGAVFREILEMANRRLELMSGGRYQLIHRSGADRRNARAGLEIQVLDLSTGQLRGSDSLSGGEGFFTSLSLALGLADVVQNRAGGRALDALFIDEGFGSLSGGVLDKALDVLSRLSEGNRLVGVISHVEQLEESIPQKIRVSGGPHGSSVRLELG